MTKKIYRKTVSLLFALGLITSLTPVSVAEETPVKAAGSDLSVPAEGTDYVKGEVIVTLATPKRTALAKKGMVSFDDEMAVEESWDFGDADILAGTEEQEEFLDDKRLYISEISSDTYSTGELIEKLSSQAYVVSAEPNYYQKKRSVSSEPFSDEQWYLDGSGAFATNSSGINYKKNQTDKENCPVVAVVDTGIDYTQEDLKDNMWINTYSSLEGTYGYDFGDNDSDPMDEDSAGHGTHCAGVIGAAAENHTGITGIAGNVKLMALKIFDKNSEAKDSSIIAAFHYIYEAQEAGVNITAVNCSWGGGESGQTMNSLINKIGQKGALFLFAAGNDGKNQDTVVNVRKECPYDLSSDYLVLVGASDREDKAASFSDYGSQSVDLFAPGTQIFSTINRTNFIPSAYPDDKRKEMTAFYGDGTENSMSLFTPDKLNLNSPNMTYGTISHSSEDFYGDEDSGSFYIPFRTNSRRNTAFSVYLDISSLGLDTSSVYYLACDYSEDITSSSEREWDHFTRKISASDFVKSDGKTYLRIITLEGVLFNCSGIYLDQVAVSCANPDTAEFLKYNFLSGTSMAAPVVSGALAALSAMYPSDSSIQRKTRLLSCVRSVSDLTYKCKTGGILDMSLFASTSVPSVTTPSDNDPEDPASTSVPSVTTPPENNAEDPASTSVPSVTTPPENDPEEKTIAVKKIKLNKTSAKLRYKKKLKLKASVSPSNASNKKIKWSVSKPKYAKVTSKGIVTAKKKGIGHRVKVYAKATDGSGKRAACTVKIKK